MTRLQCPKCNYTSGNDWSQCRGWCPMPQSPHFRDYLMNKNVRILKAAIESKSPVALDYDGKGTVGVLPFMLGRTADKGLVLQAFKRGENGGWRFYYLDKVAEGGVYVSESREPAAWTEALGTLKKTETTEEYRPPAFVTEVLVQVKF